MSNRMSEATANKLWRLVMGGSALYAGFGYAFGPENWYQSPSLELVRQFWIPVPIWGVLMMIAGALIFTRLRPYGHFLAMILWVFWFSCIAAVALTSLMSWVWNWNLGLPAITGWGAPAYVLVYAMVHMHMVLGPHRPTVYLLPSGDDSEDEDIG